MIGKGQKFHYWEVVDFIDQKTSQCLCTGCYKTSRRILNSLLKNSRTKSCGCQRTMFLKQKMLEKYGVESPAQSTMIRAKIKKTMIVKYGVDRGKLND